ncbi:hypothetical protein [Bacillus sp. 1P06AnD]|uniref:hypothetical protein n=1 Tax=Bacillus sp. 1P06AnD TaxID=3132208 RepID=UPI00399F7111
MILATAGWFVGGAVFFLIGHYLIKKNNAVKSRFLIYGTITSMWILAGLLVGSNSLPAESKHASLEQKENQESAKKEDSTNNGTENPSSSVQKNQSVNQKTSKGKSAQQDVKKSGGQATKDKEVKTNKDPYTKKVSHAISPETEKQYQKIVERVHEIQQFIQTGQTP